MLERVEVFGKQGLAAYLKGDMEPCDPGEATLVKIVFDNGDVLFATPQAKVSDFDPEQPRDWRGRWTKAESDAKESIARSARVSKQAALKGSHGHPGLISTRLVTAVRAEEDSNRDFTQVDLKTFEADKGFHQKISLLKDARYYPLLKPEDIEGKTDHEVAQTLIGKMKSNLEFLYGQASEEYQTKNKIWYDGAHNIAREKADQYKLPVESTAGVYAALSPRKDWDQNVYVGNRVIDIFQNQQGHGWDPDMEKTAQAIWKPKDQADLAEIRGKRLSQISDPVLQGMWIRTYDEAHSDRHYMRVEPDGKQLEFARNLAKPGELGEKAIATWQSKPILANALIALQSGGDRKIISDAMGERHKVRNFYNNILDPHSANGDITIDTHAVGASMLTPSNGSETSVLHALGTSPTGEKPPGFKAASRSAVTGVSGTYALYAEAYRLAAKDLGIQPRQLQSVTWAMKRKLFPGNIQKTKEAAISKVWQDYHDGTIASLEEAQRAAIAAAGGWHE